MELSQLISVNFNLRKPKSTSPTPLYMVGTMLIVKVRQHKQRYQRKERYYQPFGTAVNSSQS